MTIASSVKAHVDAIKLHNTSGGVEMQWEDSFYIAIMLQWASSFLSDEQFNSHQTFQNKQYLLLEQQAKFLL